MTSPTCNNRDILLTSSGLSILAILGFVLAIFLYTQHGSRFLTSMDRSVGEMLMKEARALEDAGVPDEAIERYREALEGRFHGPQNRTFCLQHLGALLLDQGRCEEALPRLKQAGERSHYVLDTYPKLCNAILNCGDLEDMSTLLAAWKTKAEEMNDQDALAMCLFFYGRVAAKNGDVEQARRFYENSNDLAPGDQAAFELAHLYLEKGQTEKAHALLLTFLQNGATGSNAEIARKILSNE
jgi:thioredoxin-like negative regulator of GroEL